MTYHNKTEKEYFYNNINKPDLFEIAFSLAMRLNEDNELKAMKELITEKKILKL